MGLASSIAQATGQSEKGIALLLTQCSSVPLGFIFGRVFYRKPPVLQHAVILLLGFSMAANVYGWTNTALFCLLPTLLPYLLMVVLGPSAAVSGVIFFVLLGYLLTSYMYFSTQDYDINWTTAFCTQFLRITSLAMDLADGTKPKDRLSSDQRKFCVLRFPGVLEYVSYVFFFPSIVCGPMDSFTRYRSYIEGRLGGDKDGRLDSSSILTGLRVFLTSIVILAISIPLETFFFPRNLLLTESFKALSFPLKLVWFSFWGRATLLKYTAVWGIAEAGSILMGFGYNCTDKDGTIHWDAMNNADPIGFVTATSIECIVGSFNKKTNEYLKMYIYKRVAFLGNRNVSLLLMFVFVALWHGVHASYLVVFVINEMPFVVVEKQLAVRESLISAV